MINEWKDIPIELLLRTVTLFDDRTVIVSSGVCSGWRDALGWRLTHFPFLVCAFIRKRKKLGNTPYIAFKLRRRDTGCKKNMNNLVLSFAPKFSKLQVLVLCQDNSQLQDSAVETIATFCHDLQDLDLSKSFKLTDCSLYVLAHGCSNLSKLNISCYSTFGDAALSYVTNCCRKIQTLNLCGCIKAASNSALKAIGYNCTRLQYLSLGWCENVGDIGVMSLAYGCPHLRVLDLGGCVLITDASVVTLANNCLRSQSPGLNYSQNITDRAILCCG